MSARRVADNYVAGMEQVLYFVLRLVLDPLVDLEPRLLCVILEIHREKARGKILFNGRYVFGQKWVLRVDPARANWRRTIAHRRQIARPPAPCSAP